MLVVKLGVFLAFFAPILGMMLVHTMYFLGSSKYRSPFKSNVASRQGVTVIVPVKNEPVELISDLIDAVESACRECELIIISDDPEEKASRIKELCELKRGELRNIEVRFVQGDPVRGGRVKALNKGVSEAKYDYVLVLDVDSRPSKDFVDKLIACIEHGYDACVGRWDSYQSTNTRLATSIGRVMKFTVDALYKGRSALDFFIFPLGSGTLFRKQSLLAVGLWDEVIQDDMYMGMKLLANGLKTSYVDDAVVKVLVPSSFESLKVQQDRWAYGSLEVLRKTYRGLIRSKVGILKKLEVVVFLSQYVPTSLLFLGSVTVPLMAIVLRDDLVNCGLIPTALSGLVIFVYAVALYRSLLGKYPKKSLVVRTMGSSAAITVALLPTIFGGTLKALLAKRVQYRVTPKGSYERLGSVTLTELLYMSYLIVVSIINLLMGNALTALWCTSIAVSIAYVAARGNRLINY